MDHDDARKAVKVVATGITIAYFGRLIYRYHKTAIVLFAISVYEQWDNWQHGTKVLMGALFLLGLVNIVAMLWDAVQTFHRPFSAIGAAVGLFCMPELKGAMENAHGPLEEVCTWGYLVIVGGFVFWAILRHRIEKKREETGYVSPVGRDCDVVINGRPGPEYAAASPSRATSAPLMVFGAGSKYEGQSGRL